MKIKTITCHDVYNFGASLQAYALITYLTKQGHDAEIIDYKPDYLSRHYSLTWVNNPKFRRPLVRELYILAKLPTRIKALMSPKKKRFDSFKEEYLTTTKRYSSFLELTADPPEADIYFAGSDQIWNPTFPNGLDPAFYLRFAPADTIHASYAASFSVENLNETCFNAISEMIHTLDFISVRERTAVPILDKMGITSGKVVCDPVFLLEREEWESLIPEIRNESYCFLYDFDQSDSANTAADYLCRQYECQLWSAFPTASPSRLLKDMGPLEFLSIIDGASVILSNSFHATAFSLILHKEFFVIRRKENINTRMEDLLAEVGLTDRLINTMEEIQAAKEINWEYVDRCLSEKIYQSKKYINHVIESVSPVQ